MPMETRGRNFGYKLQAELPFGKRHTFRFGNEFHSSFINDYWPPTSTRLSMMGPNTFLNLNKATRDRLGTFAEVDLIGQPNGKYAGSTLRPHYDGYGQCAKL